MLRNRLAIVVAALFLTLSFAPIANSCPEDSTLVNGFCVPR